ncbi:hypothetical protein PR048_029485 [Dryococelus australis]|uniref:Uncharacterized protein n=1 Tax=Dryococelus australis TaxID=614101 RepID=A0ABQ9GFW5_9NEOP|nr:hypothetical protein PR048_029485 [Dryococelus australis]
MLVGVVSLAAVRVEVAGPGHGDAATRLAGELQWPTGGVLAVGRVLVTAIHTVVVTVTYPVLRDTAARVATEHVCSAFLVLCQQHTSHCQYVSHGCPQPKLPFTQRIVSSSNSLTTSFTLPNVLVGAISAVIIAIAHVLAVDAAHVLLALEEGGATPRRLRVVQLLYASEPISVQNVPVPALTSDTIWGGQAQDGTLLECKCRGNGRSTQRNPPPPASGIVKHNSRMQKSRSEPTGDQTQITVVRGECPGHYNLAAPCGVNGSHTGTPMWNECSEIILWMHNNSPYGSGDAVARALASDHGDPGSIPSRFTPGFLHVGIVLGDAVCRQVFSGYSHFPHPCIPAPLHPRVPLHVMSRPGWKACHLKSVASPWFGQESRLTYTLAASDRPVASLAHTLSHGHFLLPHRDTDVLTATVILAARVRHCRDKNTHVVVFHHPRQKRLVNKCNHICAANMYERDATSDTPTQTIEKATKVTVLTRGHVPGVGKVIYVDTAHEELVSAAADVAHAAVAVAELEGLRVQLVDGGVALAVGAVEEHPADVHCTAEHQRGRLIIWNCKHTSHTPILATTKYWGQPNKRTDHRCLPSLKSDEDSRPSDGAVMECRGEGNMSTPRKPNWLMATSITFPTQDNPGVTLPRIKLPSPLLKAPDSPQSGGSSEPSSQSGLPSHFHCRGIQRPDSHRKSPRIVKRGEYGVALECKGRINRISLRKPTDQQHTFMYRLSMEDRRMLGCCESLLTAGRKRHDRRMTAGRTTTDGSYGLLWVQLKCSC